MSRHLGAAAAFAAGLLLAGCAGSHPALDAKSTENLLDEAVPPGKARVYVIAGAWFTKDREPKDLPYSFIVTIDGAKVAEVADDEAVAVDVPAGLHIACGFPTSMGGTSKEPVLADLGNVSDGQRIYLAMNRVDEPNYNITRGTQLYGSLLGFAIDVAADEMLRDKSHNSVIPHERPGNYLDYTNFGPQLLKARKLVTVDPDGMAKLEKRS